MAQHKAGLARLTALAGPIATANGLSALYSAVGIGTPITNDVRSLNERGEHQKRVPIAHLAARLRIAESIQITSRRPGTHVARGLDRP